MPVSWTTLATIDFSKAFDSVWHSARFHKLISADLFAWLVGLNLSFLIGVLAWFFKITKVGSFDSVQVFCKGLFLSMYFFLIIHDLPASLPSSVSYVIYADDLAICSSSPLSPCCDGGYARSSDSIGALV